MDIEQEDDDAVRALHGDILGVLAGSKMVVAVSAAESVLASLLFDLLDFTSSQQRRQKAREITIRLVVEHINGWIDEWERGGSLQ